VPCNHLYAGPGFRVFSPPGPIIFQFAEMQIEYRQVIHRSLDHYFQARLFLASSFVCCGRDASFWGEDKKGANVGVVSIPYSSGQCFGLLKGALLFITALLSQSPIHRGNVSDTRLSPGAITCVFR
jgi:hypothetical protein